eukprot:Sspe_Gene.91871::Locus_63507_Transcript_1_1_Confidence_1.000_Length_1664::g.91871::m.91871
MGCGSSSAGRPESAEGLGKRPQSLVRMDKARKSRVGIMGNPGRMLESDLNSPSASPRGSLCSPYRRKTLKMQEFSTRIAAMVENREKGGSECGDADDEKAVEQVFDFLDTGKQGTLCLDQLKSGFQKMGWAHSTESLTRLFGACTEKSSPRIDRATFTRVFRHLTSVAVLRGEEDDNVGHTKKKIRREYAPGSRKLKGYKVKHLPAQSTRIKCISTGVSQRLYAVSHREDVALHLYNLDNGEQLRSFNGHMDTVLGCALSPDRKHVATVSRDGLLILWDVVCGHFIKQLPHPAVATCCCFNPDGNLVVTGCYDGLVRKYDVNKGKLLNASQPRLDSLPRGVVVAISCSKSAVVASRTRELVVEVLSLRNLVVLCQLQGHDTLVWAADFNAQHTKIVSSCEKYVHLWEVSDTPCNHITTPSKRFLVQDYVEMANPKNLISETGYVWLTACFCPGDFNHLLALSSSCLTINIVNEEGTPLVTLMCTAPVYCISASREMQDLLAGDEMGNIYHIDLF